MAKSLPVIHGFNAGEASYSALNRVDQETIRLTAEKQENILPYVVGKGIMRPGTQLLATTSGASLLVPFLRSVDETALLELTTAGSVRVLVNDALVTRPSVTCSISDPTFATGTGWSATTTGGATVTTAGSLKMRAIPRGSFAICEQTVTTSSANVQHALRIVVTSTQPITFMCGSTSGGFDYIGITDLGPGQHSLAFTPTSGTFYIRFQTASSVTVQVTSCNIEAAGVMTLTGGNWDATTLKSLRYTQSLDVVFLACKGIVPKRIERRGTYSWSLIDFISNKDGPFTILPTADNITLTPTNTNSNTTLTSNLPFFTSDQYGALLQLTHTSLLAVYSLGAKSYATPAFRVSGIQTSGDRAWSATISGTWVGTINVERSFDNQFSGFGVYAAAGNITANGTVSISDADDNALVWYRLVFTSYTSGSADVVINYRGYGWSGICRITAINNSTSASVEVYGDGFSNTTPTSLWLEGEWSDKRGWPSAVALYDGRLWYARDDQFWGSVSNNYYSFAAAQSASTTTSGTTITTDASSIQRNIATGGDFDETEWFLPLQRLLFGTSGAVISARSNSLDEPLTPTNITLKTTSSQGAGSASPAKVDKMGLMISRSGHKLFALTYDPYAQDYVANNLTRINEDIGWAAYPTTTGGFTQIAVQRQPETYAWIVRADGQLCCLLFEPGEKVTGWTRVTTGFVDGADTVYSVAVIPQADEDVVYWLVKRGSTYCIERMQSHRSTLQYTAQADKNASQYPRTKPGITLCDSFVTYTASSGSLLAATGLTHLEGRSVIALGYSVARGEYGPLLNTNGSIYYTVSSGSITLGELASGTVNVGLPYFGNYKSSKLAYGVQGGTALEQPKKINAVGLLLQDTPSDALLVGSDLNGTETMDPMPSLEDLQPTSTSAYLNRAYDKRTFPFPGDWSTDSRVCIQVQPGRPATLNGIVLAMDTNETP